MICTRTEVTEECGFDLEIFPRFCSPSQSSSQRLKKNKQKIKIKNKNLKLCFIVPLFIQCLKLIDSLTQILPLMQIPQEPV